MELGLLGVSVPPHDPGIDETVQAILEHVGRDPEGALEVAIAGRTGEEGVADDQQAPALAHHFKGARDRTHLAVVRLPSMRRSYQLLA